MVQVGDPLHPPRVCGFGAVSNPETARGAWFESPGRGRLSANGVDEPINRLCRPLECLLPTLVRVIHDCCGALSPGLDPQGKRFCREQAPRRWRRQTTPLAAQCPRRTGSKMVAFFDSIPEDLKLWLLSQPVFFVASAPSIAAHINLSPKGLPSASLAVLSPNHIAYLDANGSGNESISHIRENGRMTIMFCSFDSVPRILRLFCCSGTVIEWDHPRFHPTLDRMKPHVTHYNPDNFPGTRAIIDLHVFQVQTSCGYGVPRLALSTDPDSNAPRPCLCDRDTMAQWTANKIASNKLHAWQAEMNSHSIDGLPGLRVAMRDRAKGNPVQMLLVDLRIWLCRYRRATELVAVMLFSVIITTVVLKGLSL
ncbi:hypothetical protein ACO22_07781 [Paracoccidioides brasiliensis]|uniref:Pyridoxamine 5'-phosphate oxidase putative domain-containing protein n=1 Tax=Paracoccidioides brasiliensis TaxID=121759 RepID=A0A1D2J3P4_PARBR|nr:hypothetical protein ACO22_07781 [Paracoccidioides brasiliensis]